MCQSASLVNNVTGWRFLQKSKSIDGCLKYFFRIFFLCQQYKLFFFIGIYFFYFISNNNCRLLTINIVSFIFFYYRESKPPCYLHYEKSSPLNIVYRKINWQNPASISAYTQSEYRISNYVNHIRIIIVSSKATWHNWKNGHVTWPSTPITRSMPSYIFIDSIVI